MPLYTLAQDMAKSFAGNSSYGELYKLYMSATKFDAVLMNLLDAKGYLREVKCMLKQYAERQQARPVLRTLDFMAVGRCSGGPAC